MKHGATASFWKCYNALPQNVRIQAEKSFELMKGSPHHPGLHLKQIRGELWSARVGLGYRALALASDEGLDRFWIGSHWDYDDLIG